MVNLSKIRRPSRYIDSEINSIRKAKAPIRAALAFPDVYDIGMSHLGLRILYDIVNSLPFASAERAFHPWLDMERAMLDEGDPLRSLESGTPLGEFDFLGFSLQYELCYTSVLNMLRLSGIPIRGEERNDSHPLVIAGGPCTVNPMPMSPFIDAFVVGDAEEAIVEIMNAAYAFKSGGDGRRDTLLEAISKIEGIYVPSRHSGPGATVRRRYLCSLEDAPFPLAPVVPYTQIVHDRVNIEVARGCTMGCRFCQAGIIYRPVRERSPARALKIAEESIRRTGYEEVSFSSLSAGDYSGLLELVRGFNRRFGSSKISISLPSIRVKSVSDEVLKAIVSVRKTGFTIAPEAATERLRACINKDFSEEDFERALEALFKAGWLNLKMYFMLGLPTESDEDIEAIPPMVMKALKTAKRYTRRFVNISVSASTFVPKAHTPFQWEGQADMKEVARKTQYLRSRLRKINFRDHGAETSMLEAALARGDAGLAPLIEAALRGGARLEGWSEAFDFGIWERAMQETGIGAESYARRTFAMDERLPWEAIETGVSREFLLEEHGLAMRSVLRKDCREECHACGLECPPHDTKPPEPLRLPPHRAQLQRRPIRVRARFSKTGLMRYLSHRELITHITRALRRAGVRLEHTGGFNPTPKVAVGPPLGVGVAGLNEYFDMEMAPTATLEEIRARLNEELGGGVRVHEIVAVGTKETSLQGFVVEYLYEIGCPDTGGLGRFMALDEFVVERDGGKRVDIRPMVKQAEAASARSARVLLADLGSASVRLDEIALALFGAEAEDLEVTRIAMFGPGGEPVAPFGYAGAGKGATP